MKLSFTEEEEAGGQTNGAVHNALPPPDDATRDSVLQSRQYRGQRIETPTHTGPFSSADATAVKSGVFQ